MSEIRRRKLFPCETPGCSTQCSYAFSCHNARVGKPAIFWAGAALVMFLVLGTLMA